ncbi:DUF305 domain-containing protein [Streptomyces sp. NPDC046931]|uniref:DUF305 domain-containing protein n=1 Tax=Streptomyces sp. NPDC046931 TaxID=3154806 RepID=UPI0034096A3C
MPSPARRAVTTVLAPAAFALPLALVPTAGAAVPSALTPQMAAIQQESDANPLVRTAQQYTAALKKLQGPPFEQAFVVGMIPHHRMAVAMAEVELAHGTRPELKALAQQIVTAQDREMSEMTTWLKDWDGLTQAQAAARVPADVWKTMRTMQADMGAMTSHLTSMPTGESVDQAFLEAMISHHEAAVLVAGTVPGRATHSQLTALARSVVTSKSAEVAQMRTWLRDWYGKSTTS